MDRQPTLENERLLLRPLAREDWDGLFAVASDPAVWEQHPKHDRWREDVFAEFFADALAKGGALAIVDKRDGAIIGSSRFQDFSEEEGGSVEIGWTFFACKYWGKGINRQVKRMMLAHAFESVERVDFRVGETNYRSRIALENIGAELTDRTDLVRYDGKRLLHKIYTMGWAGACSFLTKRAAQTRC